MIPNYLVNNPFPDCQWSLDMKPVVVIDNVSYAINSLVKPIVGNVAYIVGVNQKDFDQLMNLVSAKIMHFYEMRVADLTLIEKNPLLEELAIRWNTINPAV